MSPRLARILTGVVTVVLMLGLLTGMVWLANRSGTTYKAAAPAPTTPAAGATTMPSPSEPVMSAAARKKTREGAIAAFRYFIDTYNYMEATGNTEPFMKAGGPKCLICKAMRDELSKRRAQDPSYFEQLELKDIETRSFKTNLAVMTGKANVIPVRNSTPSEADEISRSKLICIGIPEDGWSKMLRQSR